MKPRDRIGDVEREVIDVRVGRPRRTGALQHFPGAAGDTLRAMLGHLLPGADAVVDLAAFVDEHLDDPLGRGDRRAGMPPTSQLLADGVRAYADNSFLDMTDEEQRDVIGRLRRGELGDEGKELVDRLLAKALHGYLSHPDVWERIGFNGPAYPEGYAWIDVAEVAARHEQKRGWERL